MDVTKAQSITIALPDFEDVVARRTNNPIAEETLPETLKDALRNGVDMVQTDPSGNESMRLELNEEGEFVYTRTS